MAVSHKTWGPNHCNLSAAAVDMSGLNNSDEFTDLDAYENFAFQGSWTGLTGTPVITFQVSLDGTTWIDIPTTTLSPTGAGPGYVALAIKCARKLRARVSTIGTGLITLTLHANGANASGRKKQSK